MRRYGFRLGLRLAIGGIVFGWLGVGSVGLAQVVGDDTLPNGERSVVTDISSRSQVSGNPNFQINGGAVRGNTLLHSFDRFSVPTGGSANFNNAANITYILSRVTGSSLSNIDGLIRANGAANVFLMNPNGIVFGTNAQLNIGGSFVGTTANAIDLVNGDRFFANPDQPLPNQLLNVNPNAFLFNQLATQAIVNRSTANNIGLRVPAERSLLLVGGDVRFESGRIVSPGSRVELAGVSGQGTIALTGTGNDLGLSVPDGVVRSDVSLDRSTVDVRSRDGGSIAVTARNLLVESGALRAGINQGLGFVGAQAGGLELNATDAITVGGQSRISNDVGAGAIGNAGNLNITTKSLSVFGPAILIVSTFGQGNAGNLIINAYDSLSLDGSTGRTPSGILNRVGNGGIGQGGEIRITTGSLSLINGAQLAANTFGQGNAGNVIINVRDTLLIDGTSGRLGSGVFNTVEAGAIGQGGNIHITANSLSVTNRSQVGAGTSGQGNAGNVIIDVHENIFQDRGDILSLVRQGAIGQGGEIRISAGSLSLASSSQLLANTRGQGNAGNVTIDLRDTFLVDGSNVDGQLATGVLSRVDPGAIGRGGEIRITAGSLFLNNGAQLIASTRGQGNAGNVFINVRDTFSLDSKNYEQFGGTAVFSSVELGGIGQGGEIRITTGSLSLTTGAQLIANTTGRGDAGNVMINARDTIFLDGASEDGLFRSGVLSNVSQGAIGQGGTIRINTGELLVQNGARITVNSQGTGIAGNLEASAQKIRVLNRGQLTAETNSTQGGNIRLNVGELLLLRNNSLISTTAGTAQAGGDGGNIRINAPFIVSVLGEDNDIRANAFLGRGGNINISTQGIFGIQFAPQSTPRSDITASSQFGVNGIVEITTLDTDPSRGTIELPSGLVDSSRSIVQGCPADRGNSFVVTGQGGLPPTPDQSTEDEAGWRDRRGFAEQTTGQQSSAQPHPVVPSPIVEATGWVRLADGSVTLIAAVPDSLRQPHSPAHCNGS
ncbi:two-partner secretion domain-containing protein [Phormidesmis sp. 146-33]